MIRKKTIIREPGDKSVFIVPKGYFEGLSARMNDLIDQTEKPEKARRTQMLILPGKLEHFRPYMYMTAMFVLLLFSVTTILKLTSGKSDSTELSNNSTNNGKQQVLTAEDYLISQLGTYSIAEYYVDPDLYE